MTYELLKAEAHHIPYIAELFKAVWNYSLSEEHLQWRFFENPHGACAITLAMDAEHDRLAGFYATSPVQLQLGKDRVQGAQSLDTMVHPDYQGKGLFGTLAKHTFAMMGKEGYELIYGFPNKSSYGGFVHKLNWHHTGNVALWVRPLNPLKSPWDTLNKAERILPRAAAAGDIRVEAPQDDALDALLEAQGYAPRSCQIARSAAWLKWRYHPHGVRHANEDSQRGYHWVCRYGANSELEAFCVWGVLDNGPDASLCELHGLNKEAMQSVLSAAINQAQQKGLRIMRAYLQDDERQSLIFSQGFLKLPKQFGAPLIIRSLSANTSGGNIHQHQSWHILGGDFDTQ